jgi:hypothetical protein
MVVVMQKVGRELASAFFFTPVCRLLAPWKVKRSPVLHCALATDTARRRFAPDHKALASRRYLLPQKYQGSYSSQDISTVRRMAILLSWALGLVRDSSPARAELVCLLQALRCGLPVVYLDPGLAEALRDTDLPSDFSISDSGSLGRRFD